MKKISLIILFISICISGFPQWSPEPSQNLRITDLSGEQTIPKIARCTIGNYYIGFFSMENGNYNVRLQLLDKDGNLLWPFNGILVSTHPSMTWLTDWDMTADSENHALLVWQDIRTENNNIVAYRIARNGQFIWDNVGEDLIIFCQLGYTSIPHALHALRVNRNGEPVWSAPAFISSVQSTKMHTNVSQSGNDQWVLTRGHDRFQTPDIFAQNIQPDVTPGPVANDGILTGVVIVEGQMLLPHLITIGEGSYTTHLDTPGLYSMEIPSGVYTVSLTHPWIQPIEVQNVGINTGQTTKLDFPEVLLKRNDQTVCTTLLSGESLPGVLFAVTNLEMSFIATTGDDGAFTEAQQSYGYYSNEARLPSGGLPVVADTIIDDNNSETIFRFPLSNTPSRLPNYGAFLHPNPVKHDSRVVFTDIMEGAPCIILHNTFREIIKRRIFPYGQYSSFEMANLANNTSLPPVTNCISISGLPETVPLKFIIF